MKIYKPSFNSYDNYWEEEEVLIPANIKLAQEILLTHLTHQ